jgi:hypothetical protein
MDKRTTANRLAEARNSIGVKKNGTNAFAKYNYYQIEDIYSEAKTILHNVGLTTTENVDVFAVEGVIYKKFKLDVISTDDSTDILTFTAVTEPAVLKGAQAPQMAGADITYMTKYLYGLALMLNDSTNDPDAINDHKETHVSKKTLSRAEIQSKIKDLSQDKQEQYMKELMDKDGRATPLAVTYWKNDFLNEVAKKEGWVG